ncbi:head maturation protease, ClpP-related [Limibacter armeniacum]|uniref:head maturation protease, ClpP-related n=1 Tax=Limibacter armeniacum TaxID=466084 RepID=UPI002FE690B7
MLNSEGLTTRHNEHMNQPYKIYYGVNAAGKKAPKEATIKIYGDIGGFDWDTWRSTNTFQQFTKELESLPEDITRINARIHSLGGSVYHGIMIINSMRQHKAEVHTYIDGVAMSMGAFTAFSGNKVYAANNSVIMIHSGSTSAFGNAVKMREVADTLEKWDRQMAQTIADKTGMSVDEAMAKYMDGNDHYLTAQEALELKLIDEITDFNNDDMPEDAKALGAEGIAAHFQKHGWNGKMVATGGSEQEPGQTPESFADFMAQMKDFFSRLTGNISPAASLQTTAKHTDDMNLDKLNFLLSGDLSKGVNLSKEQAETLKDSLNGYSGELFSAEERDSAVTAATAEKDTQITALQQEIADLKAQLADEPATRPTVQVEDPDNVTAAGGTEKVVTADGHELAAAPDFI